MISVGTEISQKSKKTVRFVDNNGRNEALGNASSLFGTAYCLENQTLNATEKSEMATAENLGLNESDITLPKLITKKDMFRRRDSDLDISFQAGGIDNTHHLEASACGITEKQGYTDASVFPKHDWSNPCPRQSTTNVDGLWRKPHKRSDMLMREMQTSPFFPVNRNDYKDKSKKRFLKRTTRVARTLADREPIYDKYPDLNPPRGRPNYINLQGDLSGFPDKTRGYLETLLYILQPKMNQMIRRYKQVTKAEKEKLKQQRKEKEKKELNMTTRVPKPLVAHRSGNTGRLRVLRRLRKPSYEAHQSSDSTESSIIFRDNYREDSSLNTKVKAEPGHRKHRSDNRPVSQSRHRRKVLSPSSMERFNEDFRVIIHNLAMIHKSCKTKGSNFECSICCKKATAATKKYLEYLLQQGILSEEAIVRIIEKTSPKNHLPESLFIFESNAHTRRTDARGGRDCTTTSTAMELHQLPSEPGNDITKDPLISSGSRYHLQTISSRSCFESSEKSREDLQASFFQNLNNNAEIAMEIQEHRNISPIPLPGILGIDLKRILLKPEFDVNRVNKTLENNRYKAGGIPEPILPEEVSMLKTPASVMMNIVEIGLRLLPEESDASNCISTASDVYKRYLAGADDEKPNGNSISTQDSQQTSVFPTDHQAESREDKRRSIDTLDEIESIATELATEATEQRKDDHVNLTSLLKKHQYDMIYWAINKMPLMHLNWKNESLYGIQRLAGGSDIYNSSVKNRDRRRSSKLKYAGYSRSYRHWEAPDRVPAPPAIICQTSRPSDRSPNESLSSISLIRKNKAYTAGGERKSRNNDTKQISKMNLISNDSQCPSFLRVDDYQEVLKQLLLQNQEVAEAVDESLSRGTVALQFEELALALSTPASALSCLPQPQPCPVHPNLSPVLSTSASALSCLPKPQPCPVYPSLCPVLSTPASALSCLPQPQHCHVYRSPCPVLSTSASALSCLPQPIAATGIFKRAEIFLQSLRLDFLRFLSSGGRQIFAFLVMPPVPSSRQTTGAGRTLFDDSGAAFPIPLAR
ncbi:unnamed protein product [Cyprideis torosa]|uniref:Uncharacterized protein n=1 Tax=Cyprideis torosa TaxID=163714 RepID=A0A7R8WB21_9CRUS|nr:unnamed protein product [Cyprideis torosa]CAG0891765.1 unnamed protein product [Cyprideis torosa]